LTDATIGSGASLGERRGSLWGTLGFEAWLGRRRARRARLEFAEWDLRERYGAAAYGIALNSSRQAVGGDGRRFWADVAARLRRHADDPDA
jgi:hypothetical protein